MAAKKTLFIEGDVEYTNGDLRKGFTKLLDKKLKGNLPRIKMGGGKKGTIDKFLNNRTDETSLALIDLDKTEKYRANDLTDNKLEIHAENVFYMIQEMESWFISQPEVVDEYFGKTNKGKKVSDSFKNKNAIDITSPKEVLKDATKNLNKGEKYHEVKHAVTLLANLDADKLEQDFPDFKRLIETLKK